MGPTNEEQWRALEAFQDQNFEECLRELREKLDVPCVEIGELRLTDRAVALLQAIDVPLDVFVDRHSRMNTGEALGYEFSYAESTVKLVRSLATQGVAQSSWECSGKQHFCLSTLRYTEEEMSRYPGRPFTLAHVPEEDGAFMELARKEDLKRF